jgi:histidinol-phosphate/aromatic aminotransferase/cobyric acid decarboxylase-like protein
MNVAARVEESRVGTVYHGGDLAAARLRFAHAPRPWIDLSTGINPHAYPVGKLPKSAWMRLPEPSTVRALEAVAASAYGARDADGVVAAPGTQALIQWLPRLIGARRVAILGFTYAEHQASWRAAGASVATVDGIEALGGHDVAVVVNPNNPDGRRIAPKALAELGARLARKGATLIVDEAFMDAEPVAHSLVPRLPPTGTVVLRSFGKFYGLAGLRLGFAIASPELAGRIRRASAHGRSPAPRSRSAAARSPTRLGARGRSRGSRKMQRASMPFSSGRASRSSAARRFSGWRAIRARTPGSSTSDGKASGCATLHRPMRTGCASACPAPRALGGDLKRRLVSE